MGLKQISLIVCVTLASGYHVVSAADEKQGPGAASDEFQQLKAQFQAMRHQMTEMKKQHAEEIGKLKQQIEAVRQLRAGPATMPAKTEASELAELRQLAEAEITAREEGAGVGKEETFLDFKAGWLSLQSLNPEISVTGDIVGSYRRQKDNRERFDDNFRGLGLHFESYLDPYTKFKAAVPVNSDGASLGEAYMTRFGVAEGLNLTIGKFRQQFGVVNRWHQHALDQVDFPLALRQIFGDGGLNQTGISLDYALPPLLGSVQDVVLQVTRGSNNRLFGDNTRGTPSVLCHYKNYRDLTKNTYAEWGLTGLFGWNDTWEVQRGGAIASDHNSLSTRVFGTDFSLLWEPTDRMRHRNVEWRTELYLLNRDLIAPDDSGRDTVNAWGAYSYLQTKLSREWDIGLRFDYFKPDSKDYAGIGSTLAPLAFTDSGAYRWQAGPYITWSQSPFVKYRLEYNHADGRGMESPEDTVMFQVIFAVGPHKHDRY